MKVSEKVWKKKLSEEEFRILRKGGTERAFSGKLLGEKREGEYVCAGCGQKLFKSKEKFDSGTGWPSFRRADPENSVRTKKDFKIILPRKEVLCSKCGGHLGHVFNDGPKPSGKRFCINSGALKFKNKLKHRKA
jgi:peptide-methionine (R)-S-oxide reductase